MIVHSRPTLSTDTLVRFGRIIETGMLSQGDGVREFEAKTAMNAGAKYGIAVSSGTAALHLALLALGVGNGHRVALPSYVCSALLNAVLYTGAEPLFVDNHLETFNIDPGDLKKRLSPNTRAVIVPHLFGYPANMDEILALGVPVVEDFAQAIGATYRGTPVGSMGSVGVCSFYATKVITTGGEGGMIVTNSEPLYELAKDLRDYDAKSDFKLRYNYKLTELQAICGLDQLSRLPKFIDRRKEIARRYVTSFSGLPIELPVIDDGCSHIFYRFVVRVRSDLDRKLAELESSGVAARKPVPRPLHHYSSLTGFPGAEETWQSALSIPIYPSLSDKDVDEVITRVKEVLA